jgi:hypothetical protein
MRDPESDFVVLARVPGATWESVRRTQLAALIEAADVIEFQAAGDDTVTIRRVVVLTCDLLGSYQLKFGFDHPGGREITTTTSSRDASIAVADLLGYLTPLEDLGRIFDDESLTVVFEPEGTTKPADGRIGILTLSGTIYEVDIDRMELRRYAGRLAQSHATVPANDLRRDSETIKILRIAQLKLGQQAIFDMEPLGDPRYTVATARTTSRVLLILRLLPKEQQLSA